MSGVVFAVDADDELLERNSVSLGETEERLHIEGLVLAALPLRNLLLHDVHAGRDLLLGLLPGLPDRAKISANGFRVHRQSIVRRDNCTQ